MRGAVETSGDLFAEISDETFRSDQAKADQGLDRFPSLVLGISLPADRLSDLIMHHCPFVLQSESRRPDDRRVNRKCGYAANVAVVALPEVNRRELGALTTSFPEWAADSLDWAGLLRRYQWNGDWRAGISVRRRFASLLHSAADRDRLLGVMDEIRSWGGLRPFGRDLSTEVARSLSILDALAATDAAPPRDLCGTRIATTSKVYAMYDLRRWVIYDSRVAWALACLLHDWSRDTAGPPIGFPQPQGRNGQPFLGAPASASARQGALAFVYASWLCQAIATRIDAACPDAAGWSATHVEMALFTIGDPKTRSPGMPPQPRSRLDDIRESIEARIRVLNDEIAVLETARAALVTVNATRSVSQ